MSKINFPCAKKIKKLLHWEQLRFLQKKSKTAKLFDSIIKGKVITQKTMNLQIKRKKLPIGNIKIPGKEVKTYLDKKSCAKTALLSSSILLSQRHSPDSLRNARGYVIFIRAAEIWPFSLNPCRASEKTGFQTYNTVSNLCSKIGTWQTNRISKLKIQFLNESSRAY